MSDFEDGSVCACGGYTHCVCPDVDDEPPTKVKPMSETTGRMTRERLDVLWEVLADYEAEDEGFKITVKELRQLISAARRAERALEAINEHTGFSSPETVLYGVQKILRGES